MKACTRCKQEKELSSFTRRTDRVGKLMSACKKCNAEKETKKYRETHRMLPRVKHPCKADSLRWQKAKRNERTKNACLLKTAGFNLFVLSEIHALRRQRNILTKIDWHVDHIIPCQTQESVDYIIGIIYNSYRLNLIGVRIMPFTKPNGQRDYKAELRWEHTKKKNRVKDRASRNKARSEAGLKVGDSRQADHKKPLSEGGSKDKSNVRIISASANAAKEVKRKRKKPGNN
jgi:hypothetical protein